MDVIFDKIFLVSSNKIIYYLIIFNIYIGKLFCLGLLIFHRF